MRRRFLTLLLAVLALLPRHAMADADDAPLRVFAAASLGEAVAVLAADWEKRTGQQVVTSLAGTATLARQIAAGAPADVFLSANAAWIQWIEDKGLTAPGTARVIATNRLVIVAPRARSAPLDLAPDAVLARLGSGRLAMGLPDAVPAGQYGRAALQHLGLWEVAGPRVAGTDSVRAALALVAIGAAPLGVVYATDAAAEPRVGIVADIPADAHPPITYHAAALTPGGEAFVTALIGPAAQARLAELGFGPVPE
ncbi:molybdate ABC transporter substrate-binding protein [Pseudaestuariivita atlantica]|uniref:Molybdenum ABC transporter substrate-binding protein n=1 Tax=Pseudaestuariivita atlantica TaxID=1317121 RepID=A0A0L1JR32_9RHOB|nr:molybdate ABC transporter substrate-binding protein [Pseudaestuariivita atlantica]KNG94249.1 hypothetical protein ATO11_08535 [Pseudaestuariivita atlantica]